MTRTPQAKTNPALAAWPTIARVVETAETTLMVAPLNGPSSAYCVRDALPPGARPQHGDQVVILESAEGPLAIATLARPSPAEVTLADGTLVRAAEQGATLEVMRADGTRLFRYDVAAAKGRITLESEAIDVNAWAGDLRFKAAGDVHLEGRSVSAVGRVPGTTVQSTLRLDPRMATLEGRTVQVKGDDLSLAANRTAIRSEEVRAFVGRAMIEARRLETVADVVVQTARNVYQRVQELLQQRAESMRTVVTGTMQVKAKNVFEHADETYGIRADKIHLG